ncbi:MAG: PilZ domain-containing protein [Roseibium sp.]|nr:PilZ domain-containing protein [Roseibium sp.]
MQVKDDTITDGPQADARASDPRIRRTRVLKKGKIIFQRGLRSIPVLVRDLSEDGAKLQFDQPYLLPRSFDLHIDLEDFEVTCERRWSEGLIHGVAFIGEKRKVSQDRAQVLKSSDAVTTHDRDELPTLHPFSREPEGAKPAPAPARPKKNPTGPVFGKRR